MCLSRPQNNPLEFLFFSSSFVDSLHRSVPLSISRFLLHGLIQLFTLLHFTHLSCASLGIFTSASSLTSSVALSFSAFFIYCLSIPTSFSLFYYFCLCLLNFLLHAQPFYIKLSVYLSPCLSFFLSFSLSLPLSLGPLSLCFSFFPLSLFLFLSLTLFLSLFLSLQLFTKLLYQAMKSPSVPGDSVLEEGTLRVCYKQRYYTMHRRLI